MKKMLPLTKMVALLGALPIAMMTVATTPSPVVAQAAAPTTGKVVAPPQGPGEGADAARKQLQDKDIMKAQIAEFLKLHNEARAEVGVPPLVWDEELAKYAQEWANKLVAEGGNLKHRPEMKYGENIGNYSAAGGYRPVHVAKRWYDEIQEYDATNNTSRYGDQILHYTQMVSRYSTKVGFGVALDIDGRGIVVANYDPQGNVQGRHPYKQ